MKLFAAFRQWLISHAALKRVTTSLVAALLVVLTVAIPARTQTAHAADLSFSTPSASTLTLTPDKGPPGTKIHVSGTGFASSGQVALYFNNHFVQSTTPNSNGVISARIKVPIDPRAAYTVLASQAGSNIQEQDSFDITPAFEKLQPKKGSTVAPVDSICKQLGIEPTPTSLQVQVWGLFASAPYQLDWLSKDNGNNLTVVASGNTTASGTLSTSFQIPAQPGGYYFLGVLTNGMPDIDTTYYSGYYSCFTYGEGQNTLGFQWDGVGWDANSTVDFNEEWGVTQITADSQGSFHEPFTVQPCPAPGTYPGSITGTTDNGQAVSIPVTITVDNNCVCLPRCTPLGSNTIDGGMREARPILKSSH